MPDNNNFSLEDILAEYDRKSKSSDINKNDSKLSSQKSSPSVNGSGGKNNQDINESPTMVLPKLPPMPARNSSSQAAQKPAPRAAQRPASQAAQKTAPQAAQRPASQAAQKPATQAAQRPASQAAQKPAAQAVQRPATQTAHKSAPKAADEAVRSQPQRIRRHDENSRIKADSPLKLKLEQYKFLFKQLVKRDFKGRYKRTVLGVLWSMLSPMFSFAAQAIIFSVLFNRRGEHFISYLIIGNVVFHYFTDAANSGMFSLASNGGIISKINVPKSIFLLSKNVSCLINFLLTMIIMFVISAIDGVHLSPVYVTLLYPMLTMTIFNIGVGYVLSAWFVFFKDTQYLFSIFTQILMYFSAIFYRVEMFPETMQKFFYLNPVYCYIYYFRTVIIDNLIPGWKLHFACLCFALLAVLVGLSVYKKNNNKFVYYF
ncbi:MAG: ABC transporter permease [Oscillospiraceae bacterium]|nr:ABC transporter permease [Oscillospiraceae bacterium]